MNLRKVWEGEIATIASDGKAQFELELDWTFPLAYAEIISGDGREVTRHHIDLSKTAAFGADSVSKEIDLTGQHWVRAEVWDVATNGAFTQPVWLNSP